LYTTMSWVQKITDKSLAKKLAGHDKKIRDKGIKSLETLIRNKSDVLDQNEMLRLWLPLFYCMWMSDKAPIQQELAQRLAEIIHVFPKDKPEKSILYFKIFLVTIAKKWPELDRLRIDKFYSLIRKFITQMFIYCVNSDFNMSIVTQLMIVLKEVLLDEIVINDKKVIVADGIRYHLSEIYLMELYNGFIGDSVTVEFNTEKMAILLEPFFRLIASTDNNKIFERVQETIFDALYEMNSKSEETEDSNHFKIITNLKGIADKLFELASDKETKPTNHKKIYALWEKFSKVPTDKPTTQENKDNTTSTADVIDSEMQDINDDGNDKTENKKKRQKEKKKETKASNRINYKNSARCKNGNRKNRRNSTY